MTPGEVTAWLKDRGIDTDENDPVVKLIVGVDGVVEQLATRLELLTTNVTEAEKARLELHENAINKAVTDAMERAAVATSRGGIGTVIVALISAIVGGGCVAALFRFGLLS